jgi:hypothetical protein
MKLITALALATLVATPAFAANGKKKQRHYHHSYNQMGPQDRQFGRSGQQPTCVLSYNRRRIAGCDPDPNIRQSLQDEDAFFRRD